MLPKKDHSIKPQIDAVKPEQASSLDGDVLSWIFRLLSIDEMQDFHKTRVHKNQFIVCNKRKKIMGEMTRFC